MAAGGHQLARRLTPGCAVASFRFPSRLNQESGSIGEGGSMRRSACGLLLAFAMPAAVLAQEGQDTTRLGELVVTATRTPVPADMVVSSVTTISGDELRAQGIRFLQDAIKQV